MLFRSIGSVKDEVLDLDELSLRLIAYLMEAYPKILQERYCVEEDREPVDMLGAIAQERNCLKKGGELDYGKAARLLLEDFRGGKLGRITLE